MTKIGSTLIGLGTLAIILNFANMVPSVLLWIYNWGEGVAWGIKLGLIALGAILLLVGRREKEEET